jgi:methionine-rich copper-binding protein CopC
MLVAATAAHAHAHLEKSAPADKSHGVAPGKIELVFSEAVQLTKLGLQRGDEAATSLAVPLQSDIGFSIPLPKLAAGSYVVSWSVASDDGHTSSGKFTFTVEEPR